MSTTIREGRAMHPESNDDASGRRLFAGKYRLIEPLAKGGMGVVYLASQEPLARRVAVKILRDPDQDPKFRERFFSEASICSRLSHPNIVTVHDYGEAANGAVFMVMEYVHGETLDRILNRRGPIPPDEAINLVDQIASALAHAHQAGIIHRDLKPSNVVVQTDAHGDVVKVLDFGIAKSFKTSRRVDGSDLTEAGKLVGTPRYMAPEQIRRRELGPRTDLYALGVLSHVMLSGRAPFEGDSDVALMNHHLYSPPPAIPLARDQGGAELDWLVRSLMAKAPEDRPESATILRFQLDAVRRLRAAGTDLLLATPSSTASRADDLEGWVEARSRLHERRTRRRWMRLAVVVGASLVVGGFWAARWTAGSDAPSPASLPTSPPAAVEDLRAPDPEPSESIPEPDPVAPPAVDPALEQSDRERAGREVPPPVGAPERRDPTAKTPPRRRSVAPVEPPAPTSPFEAPGPGAEPRPKPQPALRPAPSPRSKPNLLVPDDGARERRVPVVD